MKNQTVSFDTDRAVSALCERLYCLDTAQGEMVEQTKAYTRALVQVLNMAALSGGLAVVSEVVNAFGSEAWSHYRETMGMSVANSQKFLRSRLQAPLNRISANRQTLGEQAFTFACSVTKEGIAIKVSEGFIEKVARGRNGGRVGSLPKPSEPSIPKASATDVTQAFQKLPSERKLSVIQGLILGMEPDARAELAKWMISHTSGASSSKTRRNNAGRARQTRQPR